MCLQRCYAQGWELVICAFPPTLNYTFHYLAIHTTMANTMWKVHFLSTYCFAIFIVYMLLAVGDAPGNRTTAQVGNRDRVVSTGLSNNRNKSNNDIL